MIDLTYDPRAALEITRYHTWRRVRCQSTGEHSCQVMRVMLCVWPEVPRKLLVHAVVHDIDEVVGDIPYPHKKNNPEFRFAYTRVAMAARQEMEVEHGIPRLPVLSTTEEKFFKMCEYIEMWEYGVSEVNMGNQYGVLIAERCILMASKMMLELPEELQTHAKRYVSRRTRQENPNNEENTSD